MSIDPHNIGRMGTITLHPDLERSIFSISRNRSGIFCTVLIFVQLHSDDLFLTQVVDQRYSHVISQSSRLLR